MTEAGDIRALTDFSAARPYWVRGLNLLLGPFAGLIRLDEDGLLKAARRHTALSDFGSEDFWEPMRAFLRSLEDEAQLTPIGRLLARRDVFVLLWIALASGRSRRRG